jgi:hypothetical protein
MKQSHFLHRDAKDDLKIGRSHQICLFGWFLDVKKLSSSLLPKFKTSFLIWARLVQKRMICAHVTLPCPSLAQKKIS